MQLPKSAGRVVLVIVAVLVAVFVLSLLCFGPDPLLPPLGVG